MSLLDYRPWWHISKKLPRNPFDPQPVVQHLEWCRYCKMDVDVNVEAANADGTDVYRKRCGRCGQVIQWGVGHRNQDTRPYSTSAIRFIRETGADRT